MDKGIIANVIKHRRFTLFFTLIIIILGFYAYYLIPKQESPDVSTPMALIKVIYPGAAPEDVEKLVTSLLEDKIAEVPGYKRAESYSKSSISIIFLELDFDADIKEAWSDLRQKMEDVQSELPAESYKIEVDTDLAETTGLMISLSGEPYSYDQLEEYAEQIKKALGNVEGISRFEIEGQQNKEVKVQVRLEELNQRSLSLEDIIKLLAAQNLEIPSGTLQNDDLKINVKTLGMFSTIEDVKNTIINVSSETGAVVRLKDIAEISWGTEESNFKLTQNGQNAILLSGYFATNKNIVLAGQEVRERLDGVKRQLPPDLIVDEITFQPQEVERSVSAFFENLLEGILLVVVVVFLGMGLRNAMVASTAVPLSILVTFMIMYLVGIKVQEVSIAGLIIALGVLVDDAIVVIDSIQVQLDQGLNRLEACVQGTKRTLVPIFTATLTTGAAFAPMLFVPGPAGEFLKSLPEVVIISLFASLAVAVFITPTMSYLTFVPLQASKLRRSYLKLFYDRFLRFGMNHKKLILLGAALLLVGAGYLATFLGVAFFPLADKDIFYVNIYSETTANLAKTEGLTQQVEELLREQPEIISVTSAIGGGLPKFYITLPKASPSQDFAQVLLKVKLTKGERFRSNEEMAVYLQNQFDRTLVGGKATVQLLEKALPGAPLEIRIKGEDRRALTHAVEVISEELGNIPGTMNIEDDLDPNVYEFVVKVNTDSASIRGITNYDIQRQVNIALKGAEATTYRTRGEELGILVKSDIQTKEQLENLAIKSSVTGTKALLKEFATVELASRIPSIKKYDGEQAVTVSSRVKPGYSAVTIENMLRQALLERRQDELSQVTVSYEGEAKDIGENFGNLGAAAIFALFAIYTILMLQFKSFLQPLIIFLTIPLSSVGVIAGLLLFRQPLSFTALVGAVSLMGLVIKNAILLLEYINDARSQGMDIEEACIDAVGKRYRPIVMSATTTVIGLVPLALSGSELFVPLSVALMSGLLVSTFLTLGVIPVVYSLACGSRQDKNVSHSASSVGI